MNIIRLAVLTAAAISGAVHASAVVTSTVDFKAFHVGEYWPATLADGFIVNTVAYNGSDVANLSGNAAQFGYGGTRAGLLANQFDFVGASDTIADPLNRFKIGTITFTNGAFNPLAFLDFKVTTHSTDAAFDNQIFSGSIRLDTNSLDHLPATVEDAMLEADYFTIQDALGTVIPIGSVRVFDTFGACKSLLDAAYCNNTGSVDVYGYIDSFHLAGFENPSGGAFINASTGHPLEPAAASVPEPTGLSLAGVGLALLLMSRRASKGKSRA